MNPGMEDSLGQAWQLESRGKKEGRESWHTNQDAAAVEDNTVSLKRRVQKGSNPCITILAAEIQQND